VGGWFSFGSPSSLFFLRFLDRCENVGDVGGQRFGRLEEGHRLTRINTIDLFCSWSPLVELGRGRDHVFVSRASRAIPRASILPCHHYFKMLTCAFWVPKNTVCEGRGPSYNNAFSLSATQGSSVFPPEISLARAVRAPIYCRSCCIIPAGLGRRVAHALRARRVGYKFGNCALHAASNLSYYLRKTLREVASFHI
jgi:hypothetical protein